MGCKNFCLILKENLPETEYSSFFKDGQLTPTNNVKAVFHTFEDKNKIDDCFFLKELPISNLEILINNKILEYKPSFQMSSKQEIFIKIKDGNIFYNGLLNLGLPNGVGTLNLKNTKYEGEFNNGYRHGKGTLISKDYKYVGDWEFDKQNGQGEEETSILKYKGSYKKGMKEGSGKLNLQNGNYYEGSFKDDQIEGNGKFYWDSNRYYSGEWKDNTINGFGILFTKNKIHKGQFLQNKKNGKGISFHLKNENIYVGIWEADELKGNFIMFYVEDHTQEKNKQGSYSQITNISEIEKKSSSLSNNSFQFKKNIKEEEILKFKLCKMLDDKKVSFLTHDESEEFIKSSKYQELHSFFKLHNYK